MNRFDDREWQEKIRQAASEMQYPPTPDISTAVIQLIAAQKKRSPTPFSTPVLPKKWLAPVLVLLVVLLFTLSLVPGVRAEIQEFLQIGPLRIFFATPTATISSPGITTVPTVSLLRISGQTTLQDAVSRWKHPLRLPTYPPDLGDPDLVFLQGPDDETLIMAWMDPSNPDLAQLVLQILAPGDSIYTKTAPESIDETQVNGDEAYWIVGEHLLLMQNGEFELVRLVDGHVLVWNYEELTYRLESNLTLDEAVRFAESLR
jgi:hypothetical protein